ncbi:MAG: hypothetical protein JWR19_2204 [Pedosphaera sp.]|nr:hypothetical protein [Pedosphaera sp.]
MSPLELKFTRLWVHAIKGQTDVTLEHRFDAPRRWRFDFAHKPTKVAIEIEGGTSSGKSRHTKPEGFREDCFKYNTASRLGWVVFRLTSDMVNATELTKISEFIQERAGKI